MRKLAENNCLDEEVRKDTYANAYFKKSQGFKKRVVKANKK